MVAEPLPLLIISTWPLLPAREISYSCYKFSTVYCTVLPGRHTQSFLGGIACVLLMCSRTPDTVLPLRNYQLVYSKVEDGALKIY